MCTVGCFSSQICGLIIAVLNTVLCGAFIIGLISTSIDCGDPCYPHYFSKHFSGVIMIASPTILYLIGYIVSYLSYKRGKGDISSFNIIFILLFELICLLTLIFCVWS
eukprot:549860_1